MIGGLSPLTIDILIALLDQELHGYAILKEVKPDIRPGTIYRILTKMVVDGMLTEVDPPNGADHRRTKYYRITQVGRLALTDELQRMADRLLAADEKMKGG